MVVWHHQLDLSELQEIMKDKVAGCAAVRRVTNNRRYSATGQQHKCEDLRRATHPSKRNAS